MIETDSNGRKAKCDDQIKEILGVTTLADGICLPALQFNNCRSESGLANKRSSDRLTFPEPAYS